MGTMRSQIYFFDNDTNERNEFSNDIVAMASAMDGDIIATVSPATLTTAHGSAATRTIYVTLTNTDGLVHTWCNKAISTIVTAAKSSTSGTVSVSTSTITFVNGVATITATLGGTYAAADTDTITVASMTILGNTVTGGTSVETMS